MKKSIKIVSGNIFRSEADTLVNTVNCVGVMGKGIALQFKKQYPDMYKDYVEECKAGHIKLGKLYFYRRYLKPNILLFPTKYDWRSVSKLSDIENGLKDLELNYKHWGIKSIAVPPLGCGLGGLEWKVVGRTLYRYLKNLDISVEMYAPFNTPDSQLTVKFLSEPSIEQIREAEANGNSKLASGFISIIEVLRRLYELHYHMPIGRVAFQKIAYFGTVWGLNTGLKYNRSSFGPFSADLKQNITRLANNGLIDEKKVGKMFMITVGKTFKDAKPNYVDELKANEKIIQMLTELFCRLKNTKQAEVAATIHFAWTELKKKLDNKPSEDDVLKEVLYWKRHRKSSFTKAEITKEIRYLAVHNIIDVNSGGKDFDIWDTDLTL